MPAGKGKKTYRKKTYKKKSYRKYPSMEYACAKQTMALKQDDFNLVYRYDDNISVFDRIASIAQNYQYYRVTHFEFKFKPRIDTYGNSTTPASIPYLYWLINRGDNTDLATVASLREAGSKPIRFDDKTITVRWKPTVLSYLANTDSTGAVIPQFNKSFKSPWLATNKNAGIHSAVWQCSDMDHYGLLYGVDQANTPVGQNIGYDTEVTIHVQFKKPLNKAPPAVDGALPAVAISKSAGIK